MTAQELTKNQVAVLSALEQSTSPMSAYDLLDQTRKTGIKAPLQIYRALEKLIALGTVHRLESLNAFVACSHKACGLKDTTVAFTICTICGQAEEVADQKLTKQLGNLARHSEFTLEKSTVELRGICKACV